MVTPRNRQVAVAAGVRDIYLGKEGVPFWALGVAPGAAAEILGTKFKDNVTPLINPPFTGWGSNGPEAILDAYTDPIDNYAANERYFWGAGHTNSSNNGQFKVNLDTMVYSVVHQPTPKSSMPPSYSGGWVPNIKVQYPSGLILGCGFFGLDADLPDPRDNPYKTTKRIPSARHMYASAAFGNDGKWRGFYGSYLEFDTNTNEWTQIDADVMGPSLYAYDTKYGNTPLQEGCTTLYDPVRNLYLVTMVPGSAGQNWRNGFFIWDPTKPLGQNIIFLKQGAPFTGSGSSSMRLVGRWVYCFLKDGIGNNSDGWRFNMDTFVTEYIGLTGDVMPVGSSSNAESIPTVLHEAKGTLWRWPYNSEPGNMYEIDVNVQVAGGNGATQGTARIYQQTRRTFTGATPSGGLLCYQNRVYYHRGARMFLVQPSAQTNFFVFNPA